MANSEDEDAYLYLSEDEQPASKRARIDTNTELALKNGAENALGSRDTLNTAETNVSVSKNEDGTVNDAENDDEDDYDESEESSDDDIEFVIGDPAPKVPQEATTTVSATPGPLNDSLGELNDEDEDLDEKADPSNVPGAKKKGVAVSKDDGGATVDINAVAEYEGKPLTQLDLDELKEKPWRAPGADISDYFNYGFDEFTWTAYCHKQDKLRGEFNPQKVMAKMMGGSGGGKAQSPFPFPFMPNMPMPPNMQNMPMPPNMPIPPNMGNMPMPPNMGKMPMPPNMPNMPMPPNMGNAPQNSGFGSGGPLGSRPQGFNRYKK